MVDCTAVLLIFCLCWWVRCGLYFRKMLSVFTLRTAWEFVPNDFVFFYFFITPSSMALMRVGGIDGSPLANSEAKPLLPWFLLVIFSVRGEVLKGLVLTGGWVSKRKVFSKNLSFWALLFSILDFSSFGYNCFFIGLKISLLWRGRFWGRRELF